MDDVVIVGAGPAGLAAAATLRAHRIDALLLERGQSLAEPWRARYDRLHLHTIRWLSDLPGCRIPTDFGRWVARDNFVEYLEQYAPHNQVEPRFGVEATRIDRENGRWLVRTSRWDPDVSGHRYRGHRLPPRSGATRRSCHTNRTARHPKPASPPSFSLASAY